MFSSNGVMQGAVLVDGFVRAMWAPRGRNLVITPFVKQIPKPQRAPIVDEGGRLLEFLAAGRPGDVEFAAPKD